MAGSAAFRSGHAILSLGLLALSGCFLSPNQLPPPINVADGLQAEYLAAGTPVPSVLAAGDDGRVFYGEQDTGRIRVIKDGVLLDEPFAEVPVNTAGDRGLLGLALHPRFGDNGRVYVFYTRSDTGERSNDLQAVVDNRVVYFAAVNTTPESGYTPGDYAASNEIFVTSLPTSDAATRIGGRIAFAADRTLYVAFGDLTEIDAAQDAGDVRGKILRYDEDGNPAADNPVAGSPVYAVGFREPRAITFEADTRTAFVIDRSLNGRHEINLIVAGGNYGWPQVVGMADTADELAYAEATPEYRDPVLDTSGLTLAGLSFNPSAKYGTGERGRLCYGDTLNERVRSGALNDTRTALRDAQTLAQRLPAPLTDVLFTPAGTLYVACENAILRIVLFSTTD